jgi:2-polyprenyl-3-methyl-5-hydroxy-6-metoxy-1,4-benzoquinol methylase
MKESKFQPTVFPSRQLFEAVCSRGLSEIRPLLPSAAQDDPWGWNYGKANPPSYWTYGRLRALLALGQARQLKPKRVLEVAAGDAALCACLEETGCEVVANDLRSDNLEKSVANFKNRAKIRLLPGNVFDLSPADVGTFDLIIACELIEHVAHGADLLKQLKRLLTPDGQLLVTTPNGNHFRNKLPTYSQITNFDELESKQFKPDADGHLYLITADEMSEIASEAGLEVRLVLLWGTPFIYGDCGFRYASKMFPAQFWYSLELQCQRLGSRFLNKFATSLSVVLERRLSS